MYYLLLLLLSLNSFASRLDPIIVSSKTESSSSNMTSSHSVIDSKNLSKTNLSSAIESLKSVSGVYINQTGGPGSQAAIYIRGSEVRHVLVLIDGVKVNDPSNPDKQFNAANLSSLDIEKIEVIKGAQSVLYGSDAIGGVINIITKKGEPRQSVELELGFQKQISTSFSVVRDRSVTYLNTYYAESEGISAKKDEDELDGYEKKGLTLNHSHSFSNFEMEWMIKIMQDFVEDDGYSGTGFDVKFVDDLNANSKSLQQVYKQTLIKKIGAGVLKHNISLNKTNREVKYFDTTSGTYKNVSYGGSSLLQDINWLKKFGLGEAVVGFTHEYETFSKTSIDEKKNNLYSLYSAVNHKLKQYFFNIGLRSDNHESFGSILTYNLGLGKKFSGRKQLKFNHATGFKAPSVYQLYVPYDGIYKVGNEDLEPEKSKTFDLSFKQMGKNSYEVTIFNNYIHNYFYHSTDGYTNKGSFNSQGIEVSARQKFSKWSFSEGVTLAEFDLSGDQKVLRRPEQKVDLSTEYKVNDSSSIDYDLRWISSRFDLSDVVLDSYDVSSVAYRYTHGKNTYQLGVDNIFDREYEDVSGYGTLGMTLFAKAKFNY